MTFLERADPAKKTGKDVEKGIIAKPPSMPLPQKISGTPNFCGRYITDWSQGITVLIVITTLFIAIYSFTHHNNLVGGLSISVTTGSTVNFFREGQMGRWKDLTKQNLQLQKEISDLNGQIKDLSTSEKTLQQEIEALRKEKEELLIDEKQVEKRLSDKIGEFEVLNASLRITEQKLQTLQALYDKYQKNEDQFSKREGDLKTDLNDLDNALGNTKKEKDAMDAEVKSIADGVNQVKNANADVATEIKVVEALKIQAQDLDSRYKAMQKEKDGSEERLKTAEARVSSLKNQLSIILGTLEDLSSTVPQLQPLISKLKVQNH